MSDQETTRPETDDNDTAVRDLAWVLLEDYVHGANHSSVPERELAASLTWKDFEPKARKQLGL